MKTSWQDLQYAFRMMVKRPGFTAVVLLMLALGIGANTAIFSFVNALLLSPLPYKDPDRLVRVMSERGSETGKLSMLELYDLKEQATLFEDFASIRNTQYNVTGDGPPESLITSVNSYNLFDLLGVKAKLGAPWPQSHEQQRVFNIVLSHDTWQRRFGGDPQIVGKTIMLDAAGYEVLGVMPPGFDFPLNAQLYRRVPPGNFDSRNIREYGVIARLKTGVTIEQAQGELDAIAQRLAQAYPDTNTGLRFRASGFREQYIGNAGEYLWLLTGAVSFVLLIACVNVTSLMLTAALGREKEMAIRAALGAARGRLIRLILTESLLLNFIGGAFGLALSVVCVELLAGLLRFDMPVWMKIAIDARAAIHDGGFNPDGCRGGRRASCPSRKPHPALKYLLLERSSAILLDHPAHAFFDGLLHIYGPRLRSLLAHPEPDRPPNSACGRESRTASATGHPQPENSPAATASAGSILLGASLATLEELAGGLTHCQTGDRHQMAQAMLQALLAMDVQGAGRSSEDRPRNS